MRIPETRLPSLSRHMVTMFGGVNRLSNAGEGEFADMVNLSSDQYPAVSPRPQRKWGDMRFPNEKVQLAYNDGLIELWSQSEDGFYDELYYKGVPTDWQTKKLSRYEDEKQNRSCVNIGTKTIFFPSKTYFDTKDGSCGTIDKSISLSSAKVYFCFDDLGMIEQTWGVTFPLAYDGQFPEDAGSHRRIGAKWTDQSNAGDLILYKFPDSGDADKSSGSIVTSIYYRFEVESPANSDSPFADIRIGDWLTLDRCEWTNSAGTVHCADIGVGNGFWVKDVGSEVGETIRKDYITLGNEQLDTVGFVNLFKSADNYATPGSAPRYRTLSAFAATRYVPDVSFACVKDNRIWALDTTGHEIYASYQGDPFVWNNYENVSSASYAATVGEGNEWTGICACADRVYAFKRDMVFVISGDEPANFTYTRIDVQGAYREPGDRGEWNNVASIGDSIFYAGVDGVYALYGGYATRISDCLGAGRYYSHGGFGFRGKYYISMRAPGDATYRIYVYDTVRRLWHIEDEFDVTVCAISDKGCWFGSGDIFDVIGEEDGMPNTKPVEWSLTSNCIRSTEPDKRYVSKIQISAECEDDCMLTISFKYDDDGEWREWDTFAPGCRRSLLIPIIPRRCDSVRIRIDGKGTAKIYSISYYYRKGSEY